MPFGLDAAIQGKDGIWRAVVMRRVLYLREGRDKRFSYDSHAAKEQGGRANK